MSGNVTGTPIPLATLVASVVAEIVANSYAGVNLSAANVTPTDTETQVTMAAALAARLPLTGGTLTGPLYVSPTGTSAARGNNAPTLDFLGGKINFQNQITSGDPFNAGVLFAVTSSSAGYAAGTGVLPAMQVYAENTSGSTGAIMGQFVTVYSAATPGNSINLDQGIGVLVNRYGLNSTWQFSGQSADFSGLPTGPGSFNIGIELDIVANGPDRAGSTYNPENSNRIGVWLVPKPTPIAAFAPNASYAVGSCLSAFDVAGVGSIYVCTAPGTTGASAPTWPNSGSITSGTATFAYSQPYQMTQGIGLALASQSGSGFETGIACPYGVFNNAVIDLSNAALNTSVNPNAAAIRIKTGHVIDLAANATQASQNTRVLGYTSGGGGEFFYNIAGTTAFSISDAGNIYHAGLTSLGYGSAGQVTGITTGFQTYGLTVANGANNDGDTDLIYPSSGGLRFYPQTSGTLGSVALTLDGPGDLGVTGMLSCGGVASLAHGNSGNIDGVTTGYNYAGITFGYNFAQTGDTDILFNAGGGLSFIPVSSSGDIVTAVAALSAAGALTAASVEAPSLIVGPSGPTITSGSAVPTATQPKGSLYTRTSGGVGTTLYVSQGAGTWNAVAAV
jgi:hypothetical protein